MAGKPKRSGRKPIQRGSRDAMRDEIMKKGRIERFWKALDMALDEGDYMAYLRAYEHAFGRPPQALDVTHSGTAPISLTIQTVPGVGIDGE